MLEITKAIEWDMGHRIPMHEHKCRNPHGHRYRLELSLRGELCQNQGASNEGMIHDFGDVKEVLVEKIFKVLDHCFLASEKDLIFKSIAESSDLKIFIVPFIPTAENIVLWCYDQLKDSFPKHLQIARLRLLETPTSIAEYVP